MKKRKIDIVWKGKSYIGKILWNDNLFPTVKLYLDGKKIDVIKINSFYLKKKKVYLW